MHKVLVTGASGFIGKALCSFLEQSNYEVIKFTRKIGEITDEDTWKSLEKTDFVIHLAALNFVPESWKQSSEFLETNIVGTSRALEYAKRQQAKMIYVSAYLYGIPKELPITESHPILPNNPYALSKYLSEEVCKFHANFFNQSVTILRLFNVYGPGQRSEFLIPSLINQCLKSNVIKVLDLYPKRDYVFIDDVLDAIHRCMNQMNGLQIYNIGSSVSYSVEEMIEIIQKVCGTALKVNSENVIRQNEINDVVADISRARDSLGWEPKFGIEQGISKIVQAEKKALGLI
ncbi:MAG: NAD(P)-dependent oxidoreductase [Leptospira sp.]|nr:NAD(P)-dependent oxidoreductase [Leptospira sp.]